MKYDLVLAKKRGDQGLKPNEVRNLLTYFDENEEVFPVDFCLGPEFATGFMKVNKGMQLDHEESRIFLKSTQEYLYDRKALLADNPIDVMGVKIFVVDEKCDAEDISSAYKENSVDADINFLKLRDGLNKEIENNINAEPSAAVVTMSVETCNIYTLQRWFGKLFVLLHERVTSNAPMDFGTDKKAIVVTSKFMQLRDDLNEKIKDNKNIEKSITISVECSEISCNINALQSSYGELCKLLHDITFSQSNITQTNIGNAVVITSHFLELSNKLYQEMRGCKNNIIRISAIQNAYGKLCELLQEVIKTENDILK